MRQTLLASGGARSRSSARLTAFACTRILWNEGGPAVLVGRTMDWPESTQPILTVLPRGLRHDGGSLGGEDLKDPNPAKWTAKYGSLVTTVYGLGAADGINERGLAAHMLYLNATDFGAARSRTCRACMRACGRNTRLTMRRPSPRRSTFS